METKVTREPVTTTRSDEALLGWEASRDDVALRRSLAAILADPGRTQADGSVGGRAEQSGRVPENAAAAGQPVGRPGMLLAAVATLAVLGALLVIAGVVLLVDDLSGRHVFDLARLASLWPAGLVVIGILCLANAAALRALQGMTVRATARRAAVPVGAGASTPAANVVPAGVSPAMGRASQEIPAADIPAAAPVPDEIGTPAGPEPASARDREAAVFGGPRGEGGISRPDAGAPRQERPAWHGEAVDELAPLPGQTPRPAPDALGALLELQALRRNRLISRKQYRAKRRAIMAGLAPRFVPTAWPASEQGPEDRAGATRPLAYWGPTVE